MSINEGKVVLRPEQLVALENMRAYSVPEDIIERTKLDFEKANYELLATTSRKRGGQPVVTKIDIVKYIEAVLPPNGERQDLMMSLKLITAFCMIIDAEVVDNAKKLIELDDLKQYDVMDCIRGIYAIVKKDGWGDRDTKGRITALIETLKPDEVEFEVEDEKKPEEGLPLPTLTEQSEEKVEKSEDETESEPTTAGRTRRRTS